MHAWDSDHSPHPVKPHAITNECFGTLLKEFSHKFKPMMNSLNPDRLASADDAGHDTEKHDDDAARNENDVSDGRG